MGRPARHNCDYYPHLTTMRNHRKIKALRNKFGSVLGYAFWSMFIEYLTEQDSNVLEYSDFECELFAAELGVSVTEIREMIEFCIKIELLFLHEGFIYSESLKEKLAPVYEKRDRNKETSATQNRRKDGKFDRNQISIGVTATETTANTDNTDTENPQTKLERTKVNKRKGKEIDFEDFKLFFENDKFNECWNAFLDMRKKIKKEATKYAQKLILLALSRFSNSNVEIACEILNQSIVNSYQDVYPLKNNNRQVDKSKIYPQNTSGAEAKNNEKIEKIDYHADNQ